VFRLPGSRSGTRSLALTATDIKGKPMKKNLAVILFAAVALAAQLAWAEGSTADVTDMQALRTAVRADKKAFVASTLQLTSAEAKKFWPLYDAYQRILDNANQRRSLVVINLVSLDKPVSDLYAKALANEFIAADEEEIKARRTLHNRVMKALEPKKAARYLQLESKIRAIQAYDIAATIPLIK
jgi:Spy/CpxP family protein refolding chaperone